MNKKIHLIGIGAKARVGKDTLAKILQNHFQSDGFKCKILSLAWALKKDLEAFLKDKCEVDVWTEETEKKEKFRPLLVAYGKIQRDRTGGQYWTDLVEKQILRDFEEGDPEKDTFYIIPDIRYAQFEQDEIFWLKNKMGGILVNVEKVDEKGNYSPPANQDEMNNCQKIQMLADYTLCWKDFSITPLDEQVVERNSLFHQKPHILYSELVAKSLRY